MKLTFGSGTERQKTQWQQALNRLLSLPTSAIPLQVEINFVDPSELVTGHATDLAITTWTYGSTSATTKVRNDAPGYGEQRKTLEALAASMGLEYNADLHFNETAAHETGHALYAALPEEVRIKVAQMFGAKSDSLAELQPIGVAWEDQIIEGIAETFKEAFLPRRLRVFPNRTNKRIPYNRFPEFRRLFRDAMPETGGGELGPGESEVPGYSLDIYAQGEPMRELFEHGLRLNFQPGAGGKDGLWETSKANFLSTLNTENPIVHQGDLITQSNFDAWVLDGTVITSTIHVPDTVFDPAVIGPPYKVTEKEAIEAGESPALAGFYDSGYQWRILRRKKPSAEYEALVNEAEWLKDLMTQKEAEEFGFDMSKNEFASPNWHMFGEAAGGGPPPVDFTRAITVDSYFSETRKCNGKTYRRVNIIFQLNVHFALWWPETNAEAERLRALTVYQFIPSLKFFQPPCTGGGEKGVPIVVPPSDMAPHGFSRGTHPTKRPTAGFIH